MSTVLDVTVCLLLIGAAVATLSVPGGQEPPSGADRTAEQLATVTANVTEAPPAADATERLVVGTQAELLGRAAVANLTIDGAPVLPTTADYRAAVRDPVRRTLAWSSQRTAVTARWAPYPGAPLRGSVTVGPQPPPGVSVATATLTVPVPMGAPFRGEAAAPTSYRGVARSVSEAVLDATLSTGRDDDTVRVGSRNKRRERAYAGALGISEYDSSQHRSIIGRRQRRLTERLARDMRARFERPAAAASALRVGTATIVVREWTP